MRTILFLLLFIFTQNVFAQSYIGTINPPNSGKHATIYKDPGFNWKNCDQYKDECVAVDWLDPGTTITITNVVKITNVPGATSPSNFYYEIEFLSNGKKTKGYVESAYVTTKPMTGNCPTKSFSSTLADIRRIASRVTESPNQTTKSVPFLPLMADLTVFNKRCRNFIDPSGELGDWGKTLMSAIDRVGADCLYNKMEMPEVCKKFHLFDEKRKKQFWAYVFASIAQKESSCNPKARAPGSNGIADGLLQLEYARSLRSRSDRDEQFCKTKKSVNTQDITFQFECATSIFNDFYCGEPLRELTSKEGYWERLRGPNGSISNLIKKFPECN